MTDELHTTASSGQRTFRGRILIYTHEYPPFKGGAATYTYDLALAARRLGYDVAVAAPEYTADDADFDAKSGLPVFRMRYWVQYPPWCFRFLVGLFLRHRFDIVLVTDPLSHHALSLMQHRFFPYCAVLHGGEPFNDLDQRRSHWSPSERAMLRQFFLGARALVAVSHASARLMLEVVPEAEGLLHVVQNGIDSSRFLAPSEKEVEELRKSLDLPSSPVILCVARIDKDKGQDTLIRAMPEILKEVPDAVAVFVGDGPQREACIELATELDILEHVRFVGRVPTGAINAYFELCDVFCMPSRCVDRWEGFGLVFLEANWFGKPAVGGAAGGVPEAIEDGVSGLLADPMNAADVASRVVLLLKDRSLRERLGSQGRERVLRHFSSDRMAEETMQIVLRCATANHALPLWQRTVQSLGLLYWIKESLLLTLRGKFHNLREFFVSKKD